MTRRQRLAAWLQDATTLKHMHAVLTVFWLVMIPVSIITGWIYSVAYVSALSLWALVSGHWSAWQSSRVEVLQVEAETG